MVNRPAAVTLDVLLPDHPVLGKQRFPIYTGGPVGLDTLQFVHRAGAAIPGGIEIVSDLCLGGELDALAGYLAERGSEAEKGVRLIVGYSGWGAGQLEGELATGSWLPAALDADWIFQSDPQATWRSVLRSLGSEAAGLEDLPPDVTWN